MALDGGTDGLDFIRHLLADSPMLLNKNGYGLSIYNNICISHMLVKLIFSHILCLDEQLSKKKILKHKTVYFSIHVHFLANIFSHTNSEEKTLISAITLNHSSITACEVYVG
jgi:methylase of polypeptide subunit release factors